MCSAIALVCQRWRRYVNGTDDFQMCEQAARGGPFGMNCPRFHYRGQRPAPGTEHGCHRCAGPRL